MNGESSLHPTDLASDGGARVVEGPSHYGHGRALHSGMTRRERIASGHGTAEDFAWHEEQRQAHLRWKASPEGQAWLKSQGRI